MKSFVANDGSSEPPSPGRNGEREQRSNQTHGSITDPQAKLAKKGKGKEAKLAYTGNVMTENRNGFVVESELRQVSGAVERETAKDMIVRYSPGAKRITVGADKGFDTADFVSDMRDFNVTPHVAQNTTNRLSAIDGSTIRHCGYEVSQQKRQRSRRAAGPWCQSRAPTKIVENSGNHQRVLITWLWIEWNSINSDASLRFS